MHDLKKCLARIYETEFYWTGTLHVLCRNYKFLNFLQGYLACESILMHKNHGHAAQNNCSMMFNIFFYIFFVYGNKNLKKSICIVNNPITFIT